MKVKVSTLNEGDLARIKEININKVKAYLKGRPFATLTDIALTLKMPMDFLKANQQSFKQTNHGRSI